MVKKLKQMAAKKSASPAGLFDSQLAGAVKDSAQQIWLAGMGAFAKAQAEGGKVFDALVKEGASLQRKTQTVAVDKLGDVTGKMSSMASEVSSKAGASWDRLENIFEERTAKALGKLGVPTARDVAELTRRVEELSAAVARLSKSPTSAVVESTRTAIAKASAHKSSASKSSARKSPVGESPASKAGARKATPVRKAPAAKKATAIDASRPAAKRAARKGAGAGNGVTSAA